jgi:uncharacterized protein with PIN domain
MISVDTSALMAILLNEPEAEFEQLRDRERCKNDPSTVITITL